MEEQDNKYRNEKEDARILYFYDFSLWMWNIGHYKRNRKNTCFCEEDYGKILRIGWAEKVSNRELYKNPATSKSNTKGETKKTLSLRTHLVMVVVNLVKMAAPCMYEFESY